MSEKQKILNYGRSVYIANFTAVILILLFGDTGSIEEEYILIGCTILGIIFLLVSELLFKEDRNQELLKLKKGTDGMGESRQIKKSEYNARLFIL